MLQKLLACRNALATGLANATLAVLLMLLVEFTITGSVELAKPYLVAGGLIGLVIFSAQFWRQRHLLQGDREST